MDNISSQADGVTVNAHQDFSGGHGIGRAVSLDESGSMVLQTSSSSPILGVLQNDPAIGDSGEVATTRGAAVKVMSGEAFLPGKRLMVDSTGCFVLAFGSDRWICAYSLGESSGAGQLVGAILIDAYLP